MSWRPWYHSVKALQIHQRVMKERSPLFQTHTLSVPFQVTAPSTIPVKEVKSFKLYESNPFRYPHYRYNDLLLAKLSEECYVLGTVTGHVADFIPSEIVKNGERCWFRE